MCLKWPSLEVQGGDGKACVLEVVPRAHHAKLRSRNTKVNASSRTVPAQTYLEAGTAAESADPYPRPYPIIDVREIRERVENWQANVLSTPLSQPDAQSAELNQLIHIGNVRQLSQLDFPTVKQRRSDVAKTTKRKNSPSRKDQATSRYFRAAAAPKPPDAANHDTEGMTTSISQPRGTNVGSAPRSQHEAFDNNLVIAQRPSPTPVPEVGRERIQQVSEVRRITAAFLTFTFRHS
jgi:hypothetical protein